MSVAQLSTHAEVIDENKVLNKGSKPQLQPRHHGLGSLQNRIAITIAAASTAFVYNFLQYQGSLRNHNRDCDCNLKPWMGGPMFDPYKTHTLLKRGDELQV